MGIYLFFSGGVTLIEASVSQKYESVNLFFLIDKESLIFLFFLPFKTKCSYSEH